MGRHTQPGTGAPTPDTGFWVRFGVLLATVALVGGWWFLSQDGDDDPVRTAGNRTPSPSASEASSPSASSTSPSSASATPSPTASASPTKRPATLCFTTKRKSYITVRVPGGQTLVTRLFPPGVERCFDQKVLQVVNGRPAAVRFVVNGKVRQPGPASQVETFTVRRR